MQQSMVCQSCGYRMEMDRNGGDREAGTMEKFS